MTTDDTGAGHDASSEALTVLRGIWSTTGQTEADIRPGSGKVCRNMKNIGFAGFVEGGADGDSTAGPVDVDQRAAWRERLEREGKIPQGSVSLRDLVLGDSGSARPPV